MIVVIGSPSSLPGDPGRPATAVGRSIDVARGATAGGAQVQLVGKVGDDPAGDALLLALADAGIGHVALLRDPSRRTPLAALPVLDDDALFGDGADDPAATITPVAAAGARVTDGPAPTIDGGDLDLALRYLPDHRVIVVAEPLGPDALAVVVADCSYVGAALVLIVEPGDPAPDAPPAATLLEAPAIDPDGLFGLMVGRLAAALDRGTSGPEALTAAIAGAGWQPAGS